MDENIAKKGADLLDRDSTVRYRSGAVTRFSVGDGLEVVHCSQTGAAVLLPSELTALLGRCGSFKSLKEHARECCGEQTTAEEALSLTHNRLKELAESGFLISDREVFEKLTRPVAQRADALAIASMCFPTCNRVDALRRCLQSYIANCRQYGKTNDFVVVDDTADPEVRKTYRQALSALRGEHNANIMYAGREEKGEFLSRLIERKDLPPAVVRFALLGDEESGLTTHGANQNAMLLHSIGDAIFCADDDTLCRIAAVPEQANGLVAVSGVYLPGVCPEETWLFPDRETALKSANFVDGCLLDMHERFLGMELGSCIAAATQNCSVDLDRTDAHFYRMLALGEGRIRVTLNGILGDCGRGRPTYYHFLRGPSLERLIENESEYRSRCTSREFLQVVDRVTISDTPPQQGTFLGLDNREVLPPFLPVGRGQDILFGHVLSKCFYDNYNARLPWALLHDPAESRGFLPEQIVERPASIYGIYELMRLLAGSLRFGKWKLDPKARFRILGGYLEELGSMPPLDFNELACLLAWQHASVEISRHETAIQQAGQSRQFWVDDVRAYIKNRRDRLVEKGACVPYDLYQRLDGARAMEIAQQLVLRFGQLLQWWPDIVESARILREQGHRLAQPM